MSEHWSPEQYKKLIKRKSKYGNIKTQINGIEFDSIKESMRFNELNLLLKAGKISDLVLQPTFILQESFEYENEHIRAIKYRADFKYFDNELNRLVVEDVKGLRTKEYLIKKKLFIKNYGEKYLFKEV